jgi:hypothetical protein
MMWIVFFMEGLPRRIGVALCLMALWFEGGR